MNVLGRAKEKSRTFWVSAGPILHCLLSLLSWEHLFLIPVALSQVLISLVVCACYPNLTISLAISMISLLDRRRARGQLMFWGTDHRGGISYAT